MQVAAEEARLFAATAVRLGVDPAALRPPAPGTRVSAEGFERLVERAVQLAGDPYLGLRAATLSGTDVRLPDAVHYALVSAPDLRAQLTTLARASRLVHADADLQLWSTGGRARLTHRRWSSSGRARRQISERVLGGIATMLRRESGSRPVIREVSFAHPRPEDTSRHEELFRAPLRWGQEVDSLELDPGCLKLPVRGAEPALNRVLGNYLETLVPPPPARDVRAQVRQAIREGMRGDAPALPAVAAALALSPRTVQRQLAAAGTTYQELVDDVRQDLAREHLSEGTLSIGEITFLLGFSQVSAFHRAFKRWTGETPSSFRRARVAWGQRGGAQGQRRLAPVS